MGKVEAAQAAHRKSQLRLAKARLHDAQIRLAGADRTLERVRVKQAELAHQEANAKDYRDQVVSEVHQIDEEIERLKSEACAKEMAEGAETLAQIRREVAS